MSTQYLTLRIFVLTAQSMLCSASLSSAVSDGLIGFIIDTLAISNIGELYSV